MRTINNVSFPKQNLLDGLSNGSTQSSVQGTNRSVPLEICCTQSRTVTTGFSASTGILPCQCHSINAPLSLPVAYPEILFGGVLLS